MTVLGPRACYDEGKRVAETLAYAYAKQEKVSVRVARIFNTYGPRMHVSDGRVVSNFIMQALQNLTITVSKYLLVHIYLFALGETYTSMLYITNATQQCCNITIKYS